MAYFNQEKKKKLAPQIKKVLSKYGLKGSISVNNHNTLVVTVKSGSLDFMGASVKMQEQWHLQGRHTNVHKPEYLQINHYHTENWHREIGEDTMADFFKELIQAMRGEEWYDNSDIQTDYFDTAYYIDINIGKWNKPYNFVK